MIPKMIHYCWFGGNPLPKLAKKCIRSWKKHCKGYKIIRWDESNFDISACPLYVRQAYEAKKWAFVTDYVRLKVVYDQGGTYLDTDVELLKSLDGLLDCHAYFGFEDDKHIATGLGFGAEKGAPILREMMDDYAEIPFLLADGSFDQTACPVRNTQVLLRHGMVQNGVYQAVEGIVLYPPEVFCPIDLVNGGLRKSKDTVAIHWFSGSWMSETIQAEKKKWQKKLRKMNRRRMLGDARDFLIHIPNRILLGLFGKERYEKLKMKIKG